jgi:hypothetical protein
MKIESTSPKNSRFYDGTRCTRFFHTRGGGYFFLKSVKGIKIGNAKKIQIESTGNFDEGYETDKPF